MDAIPHVEVLPDTHAIMVTYTAYAFPFQSLYHGPTNTPNSDFHTHTVSMQYKQFRSLKPLSPEPLQLLFELKKKLAIVQ